MGVKKKEPSRVEEASKALVEIRNISGVCMRLSLRGRLVRIENGATHMVPKSVANELTPRGSGKCWTVVAKGSSRTEVKDNA